MFDSRTSSRRLSNQPCRSLSTNPGAMCHAMFSQELVTGTSASLSMCTCDGAIEFELERALEVHI